MQHATFKKIGTHLLLAGIIALPWQASLAQTNPHTEGYLTIKFNNNTHLNYEKDDPRRHIYFFIKAEKDKKACVMEFDPKTGIGNCKPVNNMTDLSPYTNKTIAATIKTNNGEVQNLPVDKNGNTYIKISKVESGRLYISIDQPLDFHVDHFANTIVDPEGFNVRDPNYYVLYDKVEFSYTDGGTWINPTAVDFFSLPLALEQTVKHREINERGQENIVTKTEHSGLTETRRSILDKAKEVFKQNTVNSSLEEAEWNKLFLKDPHTGEVIRLMAPGKAMGPDHKPDGNNLFDPNITMDQNYLNDSKKYGMNYIDVVWDYLKTHHVEIDATEIQKYYHLDSYKLTSGTDEKGNLVFTNGHGFTETLEKPTSSIPFYAGATDTFNADNNTPKAIIVREITSAFDVGLLPMSDKEDTSTIALGKEYFKAHKNEYFSNNKHLPKEHGRGPWYDLYSKALHSFGEKQPIYTFAYDDALLQDGTLHDEAINNQPGDVTLTIGDLTGTNVPNFEDKNKHNVYIRGIGANAEVIYQHKDGKTEKLKAGQTIRNVEMPFVVHMQDVRCANARVKPLDYNGHAANIRVKYPMVLPFSDLTTGIELHKQTKKDPHTGQEMVDQYQITFPGGMGEKTPRCY